MGVVCTLGGRAAVVPGVPCDNFNRANGPLVGSTTSSGSRVWELLPIGVSVTPRVAGNLLTAPTDDGSGDTYGWAAVDSGLTDVVLSIDVVSSAGSSNWGFIYRYTNTNNFGEVRYNAFDNTVYIIEVVAGVTNTLSGTVGRPDDGTTVTFTTRGTSLTAVWTSGGVGKTSSVTGSGSLTGTKHGVSIRHRSGFTDPTLDNWCAAIPAPLLYNPGTITSVTVPVSGTARVNWTVPADSVVPDVQYVYIYNPNTSSYVGNGAVANGTARTLDIPGLTPGAVYYFQMVFQYTGHANVSGAFFGPVTLTDPPPPAWGSAVGLDRSGSQAFLSGVNSPVPAYSGPVKILFQISDGGGAWSDYAVDIAYQDDQNWPSAFGGSQSLSSGFYDHVTNHPDGPYFDAVAGRAFRFGIARVVGGVIGPFTFSAPIEG